MLLGEYEHTLDIKGRLAMPAKRREALGSKFIITKGLDGCLFVYDMEQWQKLEAKLADYVRKTFKTRMKVEDIKDYWSKDVEDFKRLSKRYHLY